MKIYKKSFFKLIALTIFSVIFMTSANQKLLEIPADENILYKRNIIEQNIAGGIFRIRKMYLDRNVLIGYLSQGSNISGYPTYLTLTLNKNREPLSEEELQHWLKKVLPEKSKLVSEDSINIFYTTPTHESITIFLNKEGNGYRSIDLMAKLKPEVLKKLQTDGTVEKFKEFLKTVKLIHPPLVPVSQEKVIGFKQLNKQPLLLKITKDGLTVSDKKALKLQNGIYRLEWDRNFTTEDFFKFLPVNIRTRIWHDGKNFYTEVKLKDFKHIQKLVDVNIKSNTFDVQDEHRTFNMTTRSMNVALDNLKKILSRRNETHFYINCRYPEETPISQIEKFISNIPAGLPFSIIQSSELPFRKILK